MKKIKILVAILLVSASGVAFGQSGPQEKAKRVLDKVSNQYNSYSTIKVDFDFILENKKKKDFKEVREGDAQMKGEKFRINLGNHLIICDNENVWTYMKGVGEVQINDYEPEKMKINPSRILTLHEEGFLYGYKDKTTINSDYYHNIELTPEDKSKSFYKIRVLIDTDNYRVKRMKVFEKDGSIYTYKFKNYKVNESLPNSKFKFKKKDYPDVTVVDLRN